MVKVLSATCEDSKVTVEGQEIDVDVILSDGLGLSAGILIIDGDKSYYVAKTSPDLKFNIEKSVEAIEKIADTLTAIGAGMTGPTTAPPGSLAADVAEIAGIAAEMDTRAGELM